MITRKTILAALSVLLFVLLQACGSVPKTREPDEPRPQPQPQPQPKQHEAIKEAPCRYTQTKGIARLLSLENNRATFEFYPGDETFYFSPAEHVLSLSAEDINAEFKSSRHQLVDGPGHCDQRFYEVSRPLVQTIDDQSS